MSTLTWDDVRPLAEASFNIWVGQPELRWAQEAWSKVAAAGLAVFNGNAERCTAYARFLVLASFYRDWCAVAHDERHDDDVVYWIEEIEVEPVHVGQALGPDDAVESIDDAYLALMQQERARVVAALFQGFGGEVGLFLSLWRSNEYEPAGIPFDDDDEEERLKSDWDVLSELTQEKLAAYAWVSGGCEYIGPIRCTGEIDV